MSKFLFEYPEYDLHKFNNVLKACKKFLGGRKEEWYAGLAYPVKIHISPDEDSWMYPDGGIETASGIAIGNEECIIAIDTFEFVKFDRIEEKERVKLIQSCAQWLYDNEEIPEELKYDIIEFME